MLNEIGDQAGTIKALVELGILEYGQPVVIVSAGSVKSLANRGEIALRISALPGAFDQDRCLHLVYREASMSSSQRVGSIARRHGGEYLTPSNLSAAEVTDADAIPPGRLFRRKRRLRRARGESGSFYRPRPDT